MLYWSNSGRVLWGAVLYIGLALPAAADVYRCVDPNTHTRVFQDRPCAEIFPEASQEASAPELVPMTQESEGGMASPDASHAALASKASGVVQDEEASDFDWLWWGVGGLGSIGLLVLFVRQQSRRSWHGPRWQNADEHFEPSAHGGRKPTEWTLALLQSLEWKRFEDLCAAYYRDTGLLAEAVPLGLDSGVDIWLYQPNETYPQSLVQCKSWAGQPVALPMIRRLLTVQTKHKTRQAILLTASTFTPEAITFAQANHLTLIDGPTLVQQLQSLPPETSKALLALAIEGDYSTPTCPECGSKMLCLQGPKKKFWRCQRYPDCGGGFGLPETPKKTT